MNNAVTIFIDSRKGQRILPDLGPKDPWTNRIAIPSSSSDNLYVVSQHKTNRHWGCNCPGWKRHRHCKHLVALQLPAHEVPFEAKLEAK